MNKHLVSVSLAALLATAGMAIAQSPPKGDAPSTDKGAPAAQSAPADKGASAPGKDVAPIQKQGTGNQAQTPSASQPDQKADTGKKSGDIEKKADTGKKAGETEKKADTGKKANDREQKADTGKKANDREQKADTGKKASDKEQATDTQKGTTSGGGTSQSGGGEARQGSQTNVTVNVTTEQKTRVRSVFSTRRSSAVVANINITPRVGVVVPRTVTLAAIPEEVVVIVPEYRRYRYFIVGDQVVIVDPDTFLIVDVILLA